MIRDEVLRKLEAKTSKPPLQEINSDAETGVIIDRPGPSEIKSTRPQGSVSG
jgi:hypothetical protein